MAAGVPMTWNSVTGALGTALEANSEPSVGGGAGDRDGHRVAARRVERDLWPTRLVNAVASWSLAEHLDVLRAGGPGGIGVELDDDLAEVGVGTQLGGEGGRVGAAPSPRQAAVWPSLAFAAT